LLSTFDRLTLTSEVATLPRLEAPEATVLPALLSALPAEVDLQPVVKSSRARAGTANAVRMQNPFGSGRQRRTQRIGFVRHVARVRRTVVIKVQWDLR